VDPETLDWVPESKPRHDNSEGDGTTRAKKTKARIDSAVGEF
jgi:hypothetical protein